MMFTGAVLGLYVGVWLLFIGGIMGLIEAVTLIANTGAADGALITISIIKLMFAGVAGYVSALIFIIPGMSFIFKDDIFQ